MIPMSTLNLFAKDCEKGLEKPWKSSGAIFATDCRVAIKVEAGTDQGLEEAEPHDRRKNCERLFQIHASSTASSSHVVEDIELSSGGECSDCCGNGDTEGYPCPKCHGSGSTGECPHCGHDMDCKHCNGTGEKRRHGTCRTCFGAGKYFNPVKVGDATFQGRYIYALKKLPGCRIEITAYDQPARIFFDGGRGLIMPLIM